MEQPERSDSLVLKETVFCTIIVLNASALYNETNTLYILWAPLIISRKPCKTHINSWSEANVDLNCFVVLFSTTGTCQFDAERHPIHRSRHSKIATQSILYKGKIEPF